MNPSPILAADALRAFAAAVYERAGLPPADAALIADSLVQADLWGHQSHGVLRLGWYLARLRSGAMQATPRPEFVMDSGAVAVIDGHHGVGQVLALQAADEAIRRAKQFGIGAVGVRNSNHFGTAMYYTLRAPRAGCIAIATTNASPAMAPWGGREKIVGNNPWSIAAPAGRHAPMVLDIANTGVARGKIYLARQRGEAIPEGWAINAAGAPTTDAQEAIDGIILPMAQHKGYIISMMMDVLAGVLTGSGFGAQVNGPYQADKLSHCGHLMIAMDVAAFQPPAEFDTRMEALIAAIKAVPVATGFDEVFYPGEIEARNDLRQRRDGLALPAETLADLARIARECGLLAMLPF
jgi:LDH2 family malate/lactate/ureidoglycolate dehydrogenase